MTQGVEFNRLMLQMRTMQMEAMGKPQPVPAAEPSVNGPGFDDLLKQADRVNELQQTTSDLRTGYERGVEGIDLTEVMIASQKSSVAFQAMTQVRNRMVAAYEDIMKMAI